MNSPEIGSPLVQLQDLRFSYPETERDVFAGLTIDLPHGVVSLVGQNATGKSTLLLLAGGRLFPDEGEVRILGKPTTEMTNEEERNEYVSFIYQNMEFETDESVGELLMYVYENGFHNERDPGFIRELADVFELSDLLPKRMQKLSKGEMQRAILAFSLLYGSKVLMMDEPIFALEDYQKRRAMEFLTEYAGRTNTSVYYSVHQLELSRAFSDYVLLFSKDGRMELGSPEVMLASDKLEEAYEFPAGMLHTKESIFRDNLLKLSELRRST